MASSSLSSSNGNLTSGGVKREREDDCVHNIQKFKREKIEKNFKYSWMIDNVSINLPLLSEFKLDIKSSKFSPYPDSKWVMKLVVTNVYNCSSKRDIKWVAVILYSEKNSLLWESSLSTAEVQFSLLHSEQKNIVKKIVITKEDLTAQCDIMELDLLNSQSSKLLPNDTLTLIMELNPERLVSLDIWPVKDILQHKVCDKFKSLWKNKTTADIRITIGDHKFEAHKEVLIAGSGKFAEKLRSSKETEIVIEDISEHTFEILLKFLYLSQVDEIENATLIDLINSAKLYSVPYLADECSKRISETLSPDNAISIYEMVESNNFPDIKTLVESYIRIHYREMVNQENWYKIVKNAERFKCIFLKK